VSDLENFTQFLYEGLVGYVYAPIKKKDNSWIQNFYQWPQQKEELHAYIQTSSREGDVYISPSMFSEKSSKKSAVKATRVAWVEFDGKTSDWKGLPKPNLIVQSSTEDHLHCYWRIPESTGPVVEEINRRLTYYLGADSSGWDSCQVLRPPGSLNWKQKLQPKTVKLVHLQDGLNDLPVFDKAPEVKEPVTTIEYDSLIDPKTIELTKELQGTVNEKMPGANQRSTLLMFTAHALAEHGLDHLKIVSLLYVMDCRIKKFVGRGDQLVRLSEIASIALLKVQSDNFVESYSPLEIINHELRLEWYIEGWLHSKGQMLLSGEPGVGKTQFALNLAYHLATGTSILERQFVSPLKVTVISLEMGVVELKYIFEKQEKDYTEKGKWNDNVLVYAPDEASLSKMESIIVESSPDVVVIDSLSEMAQDDMKESEARTIMRWFKRMRVDYGVAFIVIHHNRKANDSNKRPRKLSDLYGSFVFGKLSETVISMWAEDGKPHIEIDSMKVRFGTKQPLFISRTDNLTFELVKDAIVGSTSNGTLDHIINFSDPLRKDSN